MDQINHDLMLTLAARNLCLAEKQNLGILTLCNGCFSILNETNKVLAEDKGLREKINDHLKEVGMEFKGTIKVKHLVHVLAEDVGFEKIKDAVKKPLECCGNPIIGVNEEVPFQMANEKLEHVRTVKAQALITVCPFCHMMYDLNQPRIERTFNEKFGIPVLHYTNFSSGYR